MKTTRMLRTTLAAAAALATSSAGVSHAQNIDCSDPQSDVPCKLEAPLVDLERVPNVVQLQARLSRAGDNLPNGRIGLVVVRVLRGKRVICAEQLPQVPIFDSTLNLQIGREMSCDLDEVIGENAGLALQVCLEGQVNCLKPVELGTLPYAMRSRFTSVAQQAQRARKATRANYAKRLTSDRDTLFRNRVRTGWFSVEGADELDGSAIYDDATADALAGGGVLGWTPAGAAAGHTLHIVGKDVATDRLIDLDNLTVASDRVDLTGELIVRSPDQTTGLTVTAGGMDIVGDSDIAGTLRVTNGVRLATGGFLVRAGGGEFNGGATLDGNTTIDNFLTVGQATVGNRGFFANGGNLIVTGDSSLDFANRLSASLDISQRTVAQTGDLLVNAGNVEVTGNSSIGTTTLIAGQTSSNRMIVNTGNVEIRTFAPGFQAEILGNGTAQGRLDVARSVHVLGDAALGNALGTTVGGDASISGGAERAYDVGGDFYWEHPLRLATQGDSPDNAINAVRFSAPPPQPDPVGLNCGDIPAFYIGVNDGCDCPGDGDTSCDPDCTNFGNFGGGPCGCQYCFGNAQPFVPDEEADPNDTELQFGAEGGFQSVVISSPMRAEAGVRSTQPVAFRGGLSLESTFMNITGPPVQIANLTSVDNSTGAFSSQDTTFHSTVNMNTTLIAVDDVTVHGTFTANGTVEFRGPVVLTNDLNCPAGMAVDRDPQSSNFGRCIDLNECIRGLDNCAPDEQCINRFGSFQCVNCAGGAVTFTDPNDALFGLCAPDPDQCTDGTDNCVDHPAAECTELPVAFSCSCAAGYFGNGIDPAADGGTGCQDVDECANGTHTCAPGEVCTNTDGSFSCLPAGSRFLFATTAGIQGFQLGNGGGDAHCRQNAQDRGFSDADAYQWVYGGPGGNWDTAFTGPLYRPDGTRITSDPNQFRFGGCLENVVDTFGAEVWTGTTRFGSFDNYPSGFSNCGGWVEDSTGNVGAVNQSCGSQLNIYRQFCNRHAVIYCIK